MNDQPARSDNAAIDALETYVQRGMIRLRIPGIAMAVVDGDEIVYRRGFGRAGPNGSSPTPQTLFFIGSLTKSVTALAVMQLVETGEIEPDAPVQRYLPWFRVADTQASAAMTVRHLLNQTSGLPESAGETALADFDDNPDATRRQARALATVVLAHPPGATCLYSNANYNLLGLIIEAVTGERYADYVQAHIFTPLRMAHTFTTPAQAGPHGLALGHRYWFGLPFAAPDMPCPHGSLPSGQLISCVEDMAHYLIAHLNGGWFEGTQVLSSTGIDEMHRGVVEYRKMGIPAGKYGMGWFADTIGGRQLVWHGGTLPHFAAYMALLPEQQTGVVMLFNASHHWMTPVLAEFGSGVTALLAGVTPPPRRFSVIPWALRALLLIPALQIIDVAATLRRFRRPDRAGARRFPGLLALIPNLLAALALRSILGKRRGYLRLYMPDYSLIATVCGGFAAAWTLVRLALLRRARRWASPKDDGSPVASESG